MNTELTANPLNADGRRDTRVHDNVDKVVGAASALAHDAVDRTGAGLAAVRSRLDEALSAAKSRLDVARAAVAEQAKCTASATHQYVTENPWKVVGLVAAIGVAAGMLLRRR